MELTINKENGWRVSIYAMSAAMTLIMLLWVLKFSGYGIDFTDESFYLVWMANPFIYDVSLSQFGFIYHPLYRLLGGDVALIRQINALITFGLAWSLCAVFIKSVAPDIKNKSVTLHMVASALACASLAILVFYSTWLPTPSYNSLTFQALLLAALGLLWANKTASPKSIAGWVIIGVAGWLTFMAKPSSAALLAVAVVIYLFTARIFSVRRVAIAVASAILLLVLGALVIDGSLIGFVERIKNGMEYGRMLGGGHTTTEILRLDTPALTDAVRAAITALLTGAVVFFLAATMLAWGLLSTGKKGRAVAAASTALCFVLVAVLGAGMYGEIFIPKDFQYLSIVGVVLAMLATGLACGGFSLVRKIPTTHWGIAGLFAVMPYIYAFGSNANYWRAGASAAIFWVLAGLVMLGAVLRKRGDWLVLMPFALITQTATAVLLHTGMEHPYRQPEPLRQNNAVVEFGAANARLRVSADWAAYIENARTLARDAGFVVGTPVIDMTGQSPGTLYLLNAEKIGQPWNIGGYAGSLAVAVAAFQKVSCEQIAAAWILWEFDGQKIIPLDLLAALGVHFPDGYQLAAQWHTAPGAGGYPQTYKQLLYVPRNSQAIYDACLITRQSANLVLQDEVKRGNVHLEPKAPLTGGGDAPTERSEFFTMRGVEVV